MTPGRGDVRALERLVTDALAGGATAVWLRERSLADADLERLADLVRSRGGLAIVSGRPVRGADAVHLGHRDPAPAALRAHPGAPALVGFSAHDPLDRTAVDAADYVTLSPLFATPRKPDAEDAPRPLGLARFASLADAVGRPVVALGGIDADNARLAVEAGASGVAVLRAIAFARDPRDAAARLRAAVEEAVE